MKTFYREFATLMNFLYWLPMFISIAIVIALSTVVIWWGGDYFKIKKIYKIIANVIAVALAVFIIPLHWTIPAKKAQEKRIVEYNERKEKYEEAKAVFDEQCKKAGDKIYRTVDNVDGVMLLKVDGKEYTEREHNLSTTPWSLSFEDAVMGGRGLGYKRSSYQVEFYIESFLNYLMTSSSGYRDSNGVYHPDYYWTNRGYQYVDVLKKNAFERSNENSIIRYVREEPKHITDDLEEQELNPVNPARYAIIYESNINPELRNHWIAGTTIKIIDRETDELLAEKIAFAFDPYLGGITDRGAPWEPNRTVSCSDEDRLGTDFVKNFAIKVLKPKKLLFENTRPEKLPQKIVQEQQA